MARKSTIRVDYSAPSVRASVCTDQSTSSFFARRIGFSVALSRIRLIGDQVVSVRYSRVQVIGHHEAQKVLIGPHPPTVCAPSTARQAKKTVQTISPFFCVWSNQSFS